MNDQELIEKFKGEFHSDYAVGEDQRDKSNEEFRFSMVPGGQWEGYLEDSYENRARLEFDQTSDYLWRTYSGWTENRKAPEYSPEDSKASEDDAKLLDSLIRRDLRRRNGFSALDTAVFESMACGVGAVHLSTEYDDDEDEENKDQNITFKGVANAYSMVVWDSGASEANKSDAKRCTLIVPYTKASFKEEYPDTDPVSAVTPDDRRWFNWTSPDLVYVAIRYHVEEKREVVYTWSNPITGEIIYVTQKEVDEEKAELELLGFQEIGKKRVKRRQVFKSKFVGNEMLEKPRRIAGRYIPVVPFYGYRAFIDGVEFAHGVVRKRMDSQRTSNMALSLATESAAHSHEDKQIFAPEQVEAHRDLWAKDAHQAPYLLADPIYDDNGNIAHTGPVGIKSGSTLAPTAQTLIQFTTEFMRSGTGGAPQDTLDTDASGKAINAIIKQVDKNTAVIFDNIDQSLIHIGEVYREIAREVYSDRPGRIVQTVNERGDTMPTELVGMTFEDGEISRYNDTSRGRFQVVVGSGASYETEKEESLAALKDIYVSIEPNNPLREIVLSMIIKTLPSGGIEELKDYVHKSLLLKGIAKPESEKDNEIMQEAANQKQEPSAQDQYALAAAKGEEMKAAKAAKEIEKIDYDNAETQADTQQTILETQLKAIGL